MTSTVGEAMGPITKEQAAAEASRCLMCNQAPCESACPARVEVTSFARRIRFGDFGAALRKIVEANVLAGTCGVACPKGMLCEEACVLRSTGMPIRIRDIQLSAHRFGFEELPWRDAPLRPLKAAVVGGGPAGIACAYYLRKSGVAVTLYECHSALGGMLTRGIPEYRLSADVVSREIEFATRGIDVITAARTEVLNLADLKGQGFGAVFLATGRWQPVAPRLDGTALQGVFDGTELLGRLARRDSTGLRQAGRVAVIGGGNTACDVALCLKRFTQCEVTVFYRRTRLEMPAFVHEINDALTGGVRFEFLAAPVALRGKGKVEEVILERMKLGDLDSDGRRRPLPVEGSRFAFPCDCVVFAAGGVLDKAWLERNFGAKVGESGRVEVSGETLMTATSGVFAGGDLVRAKGLVVESVSDGRRAALSIVDYLGAAS